jgi:hypothetical protein
LQARVAGSSPAAPTPLTSRDRFGDSPEPAPEGGTAFCLTTGFYLRLTDLRPGGNHVLRSVCLMTPQLTPYLAARMATSGGVLTGNTSAVNSPRANDLDVRPGQSDSTRMLGAVLLLVVVTIIVVLMLVRWLT